MEQERESLANVVVMELSHFVENGQELVLVGDVQYVVDRTRRELRRITTPAKVLPLNQRQFGRTPAGEHEVLDLYCSDDGESVVLDSSPCWLHEIGVE